MTSIPFATDRMAWFRQARFGMFIHWGLYSLLEKGEWIFHMEGIPDAEYQALADRFNPQQFDARTWARLAKQAGMGYVVFTTKHHDGFCLWDTATTDYCSTKHGAKRDFVREVTEAFRAEGIKVGLYYSLGDWHVPFYKAVAEGDGSQVSALREYLHTHIRELMSNYGKIDLLWYDGAWYDDNYLTAETLGAAEMNAMARELQPGIIINPRAGTDEDYDTCENECHPAPYGRDWEMCICINDIWGYCKHDYNYKTYNQLIFQLVNCAVQGGNYLLNVGPTGDGVVPAPQVERLEQVGRWMEIHRESICGTERLRRPFYAFGRVTKKAQRVYLHAFYWPGATMAVANLGTEVWGGEAGTVKVKAQVLTTGQDVSCHWDGQRLIIEGLPENPSDKADTVIALDLA